MCANLYSDVCLKKTLLLKYMLVNNISNLTHKYFIFIISVQNRIKFEHSQIFLHRQLSDLNIKYCSVKKFVVHVN